MLLPLVLLLVLMLTSVPLTELWLAECPTGASLWVVGLALMLLVVLVLVLILMLMATLPVTLLQLQFPAEATPWAVALALKLLMVVVLVIIMITWIFALLLMPLQLLLPRSQLLEFPAGATL